MGDEKEGKKVGKGKSEQGKQEKGGRRGRPSIVETLTRERTQSIGSMTNLKEIWKRKRDVENEEEAEKEQSGGGNSKTDSWMFGESKLTGRSPEKKKERKEEEGGIRELTELVKEMGKNLGGKMEKMDTKMEILGKNLRREIEQLKEETRRRGEEWLKQKRDMEKKMERMVKRMLERREAGHERWKIIQEKMLRTAQEATRNRRV